MARKVTITSLQHENALLSTENEQLKRSLFTVQAQFVTLEHVIKSIRMELVACEENINEDRRRAEDGEDDDN